MKITESKLKELIANTIKESLDELSPDLAYRAADAAYNKGQHNRYASFSRYANDAVSQEHGGLEATNKRIVYPLSIDGLYVTIYKDGDFALSNDSGGRNLFDFGNVPSKLKTNDKRIARNIAKWCSKYLVITKGKDFETNAFSDWHNWAIL